MKNTCLKTESKQLRERYYKFVSSFSDFLNLGDSYVDHVYGRDKFFGEYFVYWLSELYAIEDRDFVQELSFGSVLLRSYIIMQDDIFDGDLEKSPTNILLADYFLANSIETFSSLVESKDLFWRRFSSCFEDYISANMKFSQMEMYPRQYTINDFETYAEKISLIKLPIFVIQNKSSSEHSNFDVYPLIKHLYLGFQFSDDLCDWKKDYLLDHLTYPVALIMDVLRNFRLEEKRKPEYLALMRTIMGSSNLVNLFFEVIEFHLKMSIGYISNQKRACLYEFLIGVLNGVQREHKRIDVILKKNKLNFILNSLFVIEHSGDHKIIKPNREHSNKDVSGDAIRMDFTDKMDNLFSLLSPPLLQKTGVDYAFGGSKHDQQ